MLGIREEVSQATLVPFLLFTFPTLARSRKSREMEESSVNHECYVIWFYQVVFSLPKSGTEFVICLTEDKEMNDRNFYVLLVAVVMSDDPVHLMLDGNLV